MKTNKSSFIAGQIMREYKYEKQYKRFSERKQELEKNANKDKEQKRK